MLEELNELIIFTQEKYNALTKQWNNSNLYTTVNLRNTTVKEINDNNEILNTILNYRSFINNYGLELKLNFNNLNINSEINTRVKAQNSIEYKINNYTKSHENGNIPIYKCLNDIYGIRIIFKEEINYETIKNFIKTKYNKKLKCIDSSKEVGYVATHIYFQKNNFSFPWELQIWDKKHEKSNILLHEQYKQDYAKWEKENKGVNQFDNTLHNNE